MIIAATSLARALWDRYGPTDVAYRSSTKVEWKMLSMCCHIDNVRMRWTRRYLTDILKGTQFPPMFAHSLSTKATRDAEPTGITSVLSVFNLSLLLFIQIRTSPIHVWIQDWRLSNWIREKKKTLVTKCYLKAFSCSRKQTTTRHPLHIWK